MRVALDRHIETIDGVRGAKPCIAGTRIAVVDVAIWHLHAPQALAAMAAAYRFPLAAIYAAMAYYDDHQREVNTRLRNDEAFARELQREVPSRLPAMPRTPPRA